MPRKTPDGDPVPSLPPAGAKRSDSRTKTHSRSLTPSDRIIVWLAGLPSPQSEMACPLNRSPTPELDVDSSQSSIISGTPHAGGTRVRLHGLDFFHIPSAGPAIELAELYQGDESSSGIFSDSPLKKIPHSRTNRFSPSLVRTSPACTTLSSRTGSGPQLRLSHSSACSWMR